MDGTFTPKPFYAEKARKKSAKETLFLAVVTGRNSGIIMTLVPVQLNFPTPEGPFVRFLVVKLTLKLYRMLSFWLAALLAWPQLAAASTVEVPCPEFHPLLDLPCMCGLNEINATRVNCDGAVFAEFPLLPYRLYIQEFSQRDAGLDTLGKPDRHSKKVATMGAFFTGQLLFTASDLPLTSVDFGGNRIRRLTERTFDGVEDTLESVNLGDNLLGDNLDPAFTTDEFKNLRKLRALDLSKNALSSVDEGLLEGCVDLKVSEMCVGHKT